MPKKLSSCIVPGPCRIRSACLSQHSNYGSSNWYARDKILVFPHWSNGCLGHVSSVSMRACAFFPSHLDPVLDRGTRDTDAVVSPEGPTRWPVGHAVLDHEPHGQVHHTVDVLTAG